MTLERMLFSFVSQCVLHNFNRKITTVTKNIQGSKLAFLTSCAPQCVRTSLPKTAGGVAAQPTAFMSNTSSRDSTGQLTVHHDDTNKEFVIRLGKDVALLQYREESDGTVDLWHTEVPPVFQGRGIAKLLAQAALDHFSDQSTRMHLSCTYLQKYAKDFPQPAHQRFITNS